MEEAGKTGKSEDIGFHMDRYHMRRWLPVVLVLTAMGGCLVQTGCVAKKETLPVVADNISVPYQKFDKTTLLFYDGTCKRWKLDARHLRKEMDGRNSASVTPVRLTLYDTAGRAGTTVLADSGSTAGDMVEFTVWGNVYITTDEGMIIKTQKLLWHKNTHKITSDTYVQIQNANGDILRGKGLDAVEDFSRW